MKKGNLVLAALCILLGIGIIAVSSTYPTAESYGTGVPGPGLWPMAISIVMLACAAILLYRTWKLTPEKNTPIDLFSSGPKRAYISMAILVVYVFLLEPLGFIIATTLLEYMFFFWNLWALSSPRRSSNLFSSDGSQRRAMSYRSSYRRRSRPSSSAYSSSC